MDSWRGTWSLDGGVISNQASHHIDLLTYLMGDVESVFSYTTTRLVQIEADDTAVAVLKFTNGALGVVEATTATRPKDLEGSISILGEGGSVEIAGFAVNEMRTWNFAKPLPEDAEVLQKYKENPPNVYGFGHQRYLQGVVDSIRKGKGGAVDGMEGLKSLTLINAMYESMETGAEVSLRFRGRRNKLGKELARI
jgi:predicted dehydrogenase